MMGCDARGVVRSGQLHVPKLERNAMHRTKATTAALITMLATTSFQVFSSTVLRQRRHSQVPLGSNCATAGPSAETSETTRVTC